MLLEIFVAPEGCATCGKAQTMVRKVVEDYPSVTVREIHILDAADRVAGYGVLTTPFIVIDDTVEFVGAPPENDLRALLAARLRC